MSQFKLAVIGAATLSVIACSGGGGSSSTLPGGGGGETTAASASTSVGTPVAVKQTAQGVFKDSNVAGLKYISGAISGVTDAQGQFTYEVGEQVKFLIGNTLLGSAQGGDVITPIDLIENGTLNSQEVKNIVKLFMLVDKDGKPENGINIEEQLQTLAGNWPQVDLTVSDLTTQLSSIQSDLSSLYGSVRTLASDSDVTKHFGDTLSCLYSGAFVGKRDGLPFAFTMNSSNKIISGFSKYANGLVNFTATNPVAFGNKPTFNVTANTTLASVALNLAINAGFKTPNGIEGTWGDGIFNGSFTAERLGSVGKVQHRISGSFSGGNSGVFELHFNGKTAVSGTLYDITQDKTFSLEGSLSGDKLTVTASNGMTFTLDIDSNFGSVSGNWISGDQSQSGTISGTGCVNEQTVVQDFCPLLKDGVELRVNHGSAKSVLEQYLNNNPIGLSVLDAVGGALGGTININAGQVSALYGKAKVVSGGKLEPIAEAFSASAKFSLNTIIAGTIDASAALNLSPGSNSLLDYSCSDGRIQITGPFGVSGNATTTLGSVNLDAGLNVTGQVNAAYDLQWSPAGGLWLVP